MFYDYSQLLIDVQKKSNITVAKVRDLKFLKEEIELRTNQTIGYNTLRRLFGFLDKNIPSKKTLNLLAIYLGFRSFSNYKNHQQNYDQWYFQQNLLRIPSAKSLTIEDIKYLNFGLKNEQNCVYLAYFLAHYIEKNEVEELELFFKHINFKGISGNEMHKFSMIVSSSFSRIDPANALKIYEKLIKYDSFRNNIPLLYIDYKNLNTSYYDILLLIQNLAATNSDLFFVSLMSCYRDYYTEKDTKTKVIKRPKEFDEFYIVLKGRFYGYLILRNKKITSKLKSEIINSAKKVDVRSFAEEIIPALLIKEEYGFLEELLSLFYEDLLESDGWSSKTTSAFYLIALANVNFNNKIIKTANANLDLVELDKVELSYESYISLFYFLTRLKISYYEEDKVANKKAFQAIKELVKINGFSKFCSVGKNYLLSGEHN